MAQRSIAADRTELGEHSERPPSRSRLVLASECLREDVAPREPGATRGRWITAGVAISLLFLGIALRLSGDATPGAASVAIGVGGAAGALAVLPFPYSIRAVAITALGALLMVLGLDGSGPLATGRIGGGGSEVARLLSLVTLPAALLFRARYRAYPRARLVLGLALVASLPFAVSQILVAADSSAPLLDRGSAALDLAVILSGLFGFMGEDTTGGGSVWAALVLALLPANIAVRAFDSVEASAWVRPVAAAIGTGCAATLASQGIFQLLASWFGSDARRLVRKKASAASPA
jgi:hypothetical protein